MSLKEFRITLFFVLMTISVAGQTVGVKNVRSVRIGYIGLSYAYEQAVSQNSTVNFEFALAGDFGSDEFGNDYWLIAPIMRVEPRYYYNFIKRSDNGRNTMNNSANYLSLSADYQFGSGVGNKKESLRTFCLIPKWGLKRSIGNHFNFDFATGFGIATTELLDLYGVFAIDLRFAYSF